MRPWVVRAMFCTGLQLALICSTSTLSSQTKTNTPSTTAPPAYGACPAPSKEGVTICAPSNSSINAPFQLIAAGTSSTGQVKLMELWADGKKVTQTNGTPFDEPVTLPTGTHELTVVELDVTGAYIKSAPFKVTVEGNASETCSLPASPGINVCEPMLNSCHTSAWVTVLAAAKGESGTVARMELWVNGGKIANFPGDQINTNLFIQDFSTVTIYEIDSKGAIIKSAPIVVQSC